MQCGNSRTECGGELGEATLLTLRGAGVSGTRLIENLPRPYRVETGELHRFRCDDGADEGVGDGRIEGMKSAWLHHHWPG